MADLSKLMAELKTLKQAAITPSVKPIGYIEIAAATSLRMDKIATVMTVISKEPTDRYFVPIYAAPPGEEN